MRAYLKETPVTQYKHKTEQSVYMTISTFILPRSVCQQAKKYLHQTNKSVYIYMLTPPPPHDLGRKAFRAHRNEI